MGRRPGQAEARLPGGGDGEGRQEAACAPSLDRGTRCLPKTLTGHLTNGALPHILIISKTFDLR